MRPFQAFTAVALPLLRNNIDTDAIIPSREIKTVAKTGLAQGLFAGWRYLDQDHRRNDPSFELNQPAYHGAQILLAGHNLGCGSSREQAVWALAEYGFRALLAPTFNPIFFRNCVRNGIVPAALPMEALEAMASWVRVAPETNRLSVDLEARRIRAGSERIWPFDIPDEARESLLLGMDAIDATLRLSKRIEQFVEADRSRRPWAYDIEALNGPVQAPPDML